MKSPPRDFPGPAGDFIPRKDDDVGRVTTPVRIENYYDVEAAAAGTLPPEAVRVVEVADALVDTGASTFCLPPSLIEALGLRRLGEKRARTARGVLTLGIYSGVRLVIQDRDSVCRVTEIPEGSPVLIGQIPLEEMDLVVAPKEQTLGPNPAHDNQWVIEIY